MNYIEDQKIKQATQKFIKMGATLGTLNAECNSILNILNFASLYFEMKID